MAWVACKGGPWNIGPLDELPTAREIHFNLVKCTEKVAQKLLDAGRISHDGDVVYLDGDFLYRRTRKED